MFKNVEYARLKNVLLADKIASPDRLNDVVTQDILKVLASYMDIHRDNVKLSIEVTDDGYNVTFKATAGRLKSFRTIP